ncbi:MAG: HDIG domain-containing protein, partial [Candidatus Eisenbacteria bacterium]|nr:HDIG domain-containing protein [Candidatus Eisenbacteria bacterium]
MASFLQRLIPFRKRRRVRLAHEIPALSPRQRWMWRGGLGLAIFLATIFLFPLRVSIEPPEYLVGSISSEEIIAPFEFEVKKSQAEFEREQAVAAEGVKSIFTRDDQGIPVSRILAQLERSRRDPWLMSRMQDSLEVRFSRDLQTSLALPDTGRILVQALGESLSQIRTTGFLDAQDAQLLEQQGTVMLREGASQREVGASDLYDRNRVQALGERRGSELYGELGKQVLSELLDVFSSPNVFFDPAATNEARELAREQVNPVRGQVQRGERIIDSNVRITQEHAATLAALEEALRARAAGGGARSWIGPILGRMVLVSAFLILLAVFLRGTQREVWDNFSLLTLLGLISLITLGFAAAIVRTPDLSPFLIPSAFAGILVALLLNDIVALATVVWLTALISTVTGWGLPVALVGLVGGATAVFSVHGVKHRIGVYRSMLWIALANMAVVLGLRLIGGSGRSAGLLTELAWSMGSAGLFTALAMLSLPVFERSFDLATDISLLELSDLNRSIFKRMMIEANGTYHHSMVIGSLAEAAAEAVGANPLLARVGAYYHDIGKIAKSNYFGENLRRGSKNPHERLTPTMSSLILESHVREGLE